MAEPTQAWQHSLVRRRIDVRENARGTLDVTAARHGGRDSEQRRTLKGFIHAEARGWELVEWNAGDVIEVPAGALPATWCIADSWQVRRNTNGEGWQVTQTHGWGAATEQYELSWICGKHAAL